ncbi:MAG TPA: hypothetical protein ENJ09_05550 [Planctomycetes bacterium]|nr:hypothetical protein [Planctomycetota bacterium]
MAGEREFHEEEFESFLGADPRPEARKEFRDRCREAFLGAGQAGFQGAGGAGRESWSREGVGARTGNTVEDRLERIIAGTPRPEASPAFREELRGRFLSAGVPEPARATSPPSLLRRVIVWTAAAAAFLFVTFYLPKEQRWRVRDVRGGDRIEVAGVVYGSGDARRLGDLLSEGAAVDSLDAVIDLELSDWLRVRVLGGSEVELAALPELGGDEPLVFSLTQGEIYVKTLEGYPGNPILIETPEQRIRVTGTVLGVMRDEKGTCCCVARGSVEVEDLRASGAEVEVRSCHSHISHCGGGGVEWREWPADPEKAPSHMAPLLAFATQG